MNGVSDNPGCDISVRSSAIRAGTRCFVYSPVLFLGCFQPALYQSNVGCVLSPPQAKVAGTAVMKVPASTDGKACQSLLWSEPIRTITVGPTIALSSFKVNASEPHDRASDVSSLYGVQIITGLDMWHETPQNIEGYLLGNLWDSTVESWRDCYILISTQKLSLVSGACPCCKCATCNNIVEAYLNGLYPGQQGRY